MHSTKSDSEQLNSDRGCSKSVSMQRNHDQHSEIFSESEHLLHELQLFELLSMSYENRLFFYEISMNKHLSHSKWCSDHERKQKNFLLISLFLHRRHHSRFNESETQQSNFLLLVSVAIPSYEHSRFSEMQQQRQEHHSSKSHMHMVKWEQRISSMEQNSDSSWMLVFRFCLSLQRCMVLQNKLQDRWLKMEKSHSTMFKKHSEEWHQLVDWWQIWCEFKQKLWLENGRIWKINSQCFSNECEMQWFQLQRWLSMVFHGSLISLQIASKECRWSRQSWQHSSSIAGIIWQMFSMVLWYFSRNSRLYGQQHSSSCETMLT